MGRRVLLLAWLVFAFVAWNVAFDRQVAVEGARFVRANVERSQAGEQPLTIAAGYRPTVVHAARQASLLSGAILAVGMAISGRRLFAPPANHPERRER